MANRRLKKARHKRNRSTLRQKAKFAKEAAPDPRADPWRPMRKKGSGQEHLEDATSRLAVPLGELLEGHVTDG